MRHRLRTRGSRAALPHLQHAVFGLEQLPRHDTCCSTPLVVRWLLTGVLLSCATAGGLAESCNSSSDLGVGSVPPGVCLKRGGESLTAACRACLEGPSWQEKIRKMLGGSQGAVARTLVPAIEMSNWEGHQLQGTILRILLEEVLGYRTTVAYYEDVRDVINRVGEGCTTINPEVWGSHSSKKASYTNHVTERGTARSAGMGSVGLETIFVKGDRSGLLARYTSLQQAHPCSGAAMDAFPADGSTPEAALRRSDGTLPCPAGAADQPWPRSNCTRGRWYPPQCLPLGVGGYSGECRELYFATPSWTEGWLESVVHKLGLKFSVVYLGDEASNFSALCDSMTGNEEAMAFYWWKPSALVARCDAYELQLPSFSSECGDSYRKEPLDSGVNCTQPTDVLQKTINAAAHDGDPVLAALWQGYFLTTDDQYSMLAASGRPDFTVEGAACDWVKRNEGVWGQWIRHLPAEDAEGDDSWLSPVYISGGIALVVVWVAGALACWVRHRNMQRTLMQTINNLEEQIDGGGHRPNVEVDTELDKLISQAENLIDCMQGGSSTPRTPMATHRSLSFRRGVSPAAHSEPQRQTCSDLRKVLTKMRKLPRDKLMSVNVISHLQESGVDKDIIREVHSHLNHSLTVDMRARHSNRYDALEQAADCGGSGGAASDASEEAGFLSVVSVSVESFQSDTEDVKLKDICDWSTFDIFEVAYVQPPGTLFVKLFHSIADRGLNAVRPLKLSRPAWAQALKEAEAKYESPYHDTANAYHNALHGADVLCTAAGMLVSSPGEVLGGELSPVTKLSVCVAALFHDFAHPGISARFLEAVHSPVAITYSDDSILERMHLAETFRLLRAHKCLQELRDTNYRTFRRLVIDMVLATDLANGFKNIASVKALHSDLFANPGDGDSFISETGSNVSSSDLHAEMLNCIVECADISHPAKPLRLHQRWSVLVTHEFIGQGEMEHALGLPVSPLCNREAIMDPSKFPRCQQGFIEFVVAPKIRVISKIFGQESWVKFLEDNLRFWSAPGAPGFEEVGRRLKQSPAFTSWVERASTMT